MNKIYFISLLLVAVFAACQKDNEIIEKPIEDPIVEPELKIDNHIAATINGKRLTIFEKDSLNPIETENHSFSFGRVITTHLADNNKDTSLFISGYMNSTQLKVRFPYCKEEGKFNMMRCSDSISTLGGFYCNTHNFAVDSGFVEFKTTFYPTEKLDEFKVGELEVTQIDWKKRIVSGTFNYKAFGYYKDWKPKGYTKITAMDTTLLVTDGAFYVQWDEKLKINPETTRIKTKNGIQVTTELFESKSIETP